MEVIQPYIGESHTSLDDKGRLSIPVQYRSVMDVLDHEVWYLTRGFDGAIFMFPSGVWNSLLEAQEGYWPLDPRMLDFRRIFVGGAAKAKRDGQNRLMVPSHLREHAGIVKAAVLIGVSDHLELWSEAGWAAFCRNQAEEYKRRAIELASSWRRESATTEGVAEGDNN